MHCKPRQALGGGVAARGDTESRLLLARAVNDEQSANRVVFVREPKREAYGAVAMFKDVYGKLWDLLQPA